MDGGVEDEERIRTVGDAVGRHGEGHRLAVPVPIAGEPGEGIYGAEGDRAAGGIGRQLLRECPIFLVQGPRR